MLFQARAGNLRRLPGLLQQSHPKNSLSSFHYRGHDFQHWCFCFRAWAFTGTKEICRYAFLFSKPRRQACNYNPVISASDRHHHRHLHRRSAEDSVIRYHRMPQAPSCVTSRLIATHAKEKRTRMKVLDIQHAYAVALGSSRQPIGCALINSQHASHAPF